MERVDRQREQEGVSGGFFFFLSMGLLCRGLSAQFALSLHCFSRLSLSPSCFIRKKNCLNEVFPAPSIWLYHFVLGVFFPGYTAQTPLSNGQKIKYIMHSSSILLGTPSLIISHFRMGEIELL